MKKDYLISFSYTLDFISWECPNCGNLVEKCGENLYDLDCEECGYQREECPQDSQDTTGEWEFRTFTKENEE